MPGQSPVKVFYTRMLLAMLRAAVHNAAHAQQEMDTDKATPLLHSGD